MDTDREGGGRRYTFVDYDVNRRGVTDLARAHLMKDRLRSKEEARSQRLSRNRSFSLRWVQPKQNNEERRTDRRPGARPDEPGSYYAATAGSEQDDLWSSLPPTSLDSVPTRPLGGKQIDTAPWFGAQHDSVDRLSISSHNSWSLGKRGDRTNASRSTESPASSQSSAHTPAVESPGATSNPKIPLVSLNGDLEFGLSCLDIANTPPSSHPFDELETWACADKTTIPLTPPERNLVRYFATSACTMFRFNEFPAIIQEHNPIQNLFMPFALSSHWCFGTMVLLYSTYHHRRALLASDSMVVEAEDQHLACRQNDILVRTRSRISALALYRDSSDEDIIAFLFLAISEYCAGNRQIGVMHFQAWKEYCEMRRRLAVRPCSLPCKIVVWWCVSMLVDKDVNLDTILSPLTRAQVRRDPERLFRYFVKHNNETSVDGGGGWSLEYNAGDGR